jgi:hypothetical protein
MTAMASKYVLSKVIRLQSRLLFLTDDGEHSSTDPTNLKIKFVKYRLLVEFMAAGGHHRSYLVTKV